eukprot:UC1_evm1s1907
MRALEKDIEAQSRGLTIRAVRVTKPKIPEAIRRNYELMEAEKTQLMIAEQHQKVVEKQAETERKKAIIEAEKQSAVAQIKETEMVRAKESEQARARVANAMHLEKQRALADAEHYAAERKAAANEAMLSENYLRLAAIHAIANNTKVYFGPDVPKIYAGAWPTN